MWRYLITCCLCSACAVSCSAPPSRNCGKGDQPPATGSLAALQTQWERSVATLGQSSKDTMIPRMDRLIELLRQSTPAQREQYFRDLLKSLQQGEVGTRGFVDTLLGPFIVYLTDCQDREHLVELLATECPRAVYLTPDIEFFLADSKMPDGVLILFDCYDRCKTDANRANVARAIIRAFAPLADRAGIWVDEPDMNLLARRDFIDSCKAWYLQHRHDLALNSSYSEHSMHLPTRDLYLNEPLWKVPK